MSLRDLAARHYRQFLNDDRHGFGWAVVVVSPAGVESVELKGFSNDIALVLDPETGLAVSGRQASVTVTLADVLEQFGEIPRRIMDQAVKPWRVRFDDIEGAEHTFMVVASDPDRAIGSVVLMLEAWTDGPAD